MAETISPEERLFKVIQQGKQTSGQVSRGKEQKTGGWLEDLKRFIARQAGGKKGADGKEALLARIKWPELEPENINKILAVILVVVLGVAVYTALGKRKDVATIAEAISQIRISPEEGQGKTQPLRGIAFYLSAIQKRDLFHSGVVAPVNENMQKRSEPLKKATESMKLQGISWGDTPKAMILWQEGKESKDNKMYFLVEGQAIGTTGYRVTKISRTEVKVGDGREETVLL